MKLPQFIKKFFEKKGFIKSTQVGDGIYLRHYTGFYPTIEQMQKLGWVFDWMGAEGPYYHLHKDGQVSYTLQIVQQGPDCPSVINLNEKIKGYQNCHLSKTDQSNGERKYERLFFGYIYDMEDIEQLMAQFVK